MLIEVCGPGCVRCHKTKDNVLKAIEELGLKDGDDVAVTEIKDLRLMAARSVILTPAVLIDGDKACEGRIPSPEEIKKWIEARLPKK
jgi:small redox-active disulfide protein 2